MFDHPEGLATVKYIYKYMIVFKYTFSGGGGPNFRARLSFFGSVEVTL